MDSATNYVDTKVKQGFNNVNASIDKGFSKIEKTLNISSSTPVYGYAKDKIKENVGMVEGGVEEIVSTVTGTISLVAKHNAPVQALRNFNTAVDIIKDPKAYVKKTSDSFKALGEIVTHPKEVFNNTKNAISNFSKELKADPYKKGNLEGRAAVVVGSFLVGAGEASAASKAANTAEKVEQASTEGTVLFGQSSVSSNFSKKGAFNGASIDSVVDKLKSGALKPDDLPIEYIVRDEKMITLNNRSLTALSKAGMQPTQLINKTDIAKLEKDLTNRLSEMGGQPSSSMYIRGTKETIHLP